MNRMACKNGEKFLISLGFSRCWKAWYRIDTLTSAINQDMIIPAMTYAGTLVDDTSNTRRMKAMIENFMVATASIYMIWAAYTRFKICLMSAGEAFWICLPRPYFTPAHVVRLKVCEEELANIEISCFLPPSFRGIKREEFLTNYLDYTDAPREDQSGNNQVIVQFDRLTCNLSRKKAQDDCNTREAHHGNSNAVKQRSIVVVRVARIIINYPE